ncbi:MAG: alpha/beta hydrolase [Candidatus Velthaea sp.]
MRIAGRELEVVTIAGDLAKPPIVMLHEGLGSVSLWKDFPQKIAERTGCPLVVFSRYGYGRSDVLAERRDVGYMHDEAQHTLPALLHELQIERPILFGHSDGASIAILYAGNPAHAPLALILEAPHVFVEDLSVASIAEAKTAFATTDLPRRLARHHADAGATFRGWNDIWLDPRFRTWNIEGSLPRIRCPVLLLQGVEDEYGTTAQLDAIAGAVANTETVMLSPCGHSPHRDQPAAVLDAVAHFVAALTVPPLVRKTH